MMSFTCAVKFVTVHTCKTDYVSFFCCFGLKVLLRSGLPPVCILNMQTKRKAGVKHRTLEPLSVKSEALLSFTLRQPITEAKKNTTGPLSKGVYRSVVNSLKNYVCDLSFWHEQPPNLIFHKVSLNREVLPT